MQRYTALLVIAALFAVTCNAKDFYDVCDQVRLLGYPCEHHTVTTEDYFQLLMIRIPPKTTGAYPVILQHGLLDSAVTWVFNYHPAQNLGCILHDQGYDVWMSNSRGNHYSMNNTKYTGTTYWQATDMDGMAMYDVPGNIDYVLNFTGHTTLSYVGHSQGGWQAFSAFSTVRKNYATKVDVFIGLAPACYVAHQESLLLSIVADLDAATILNIFGDEEFLSNDWLIRKIAEVCKDISCPSILEILVGDGQPANINSSQLETATRYTPGGASTFNLIHWQQEIQTGRYQMHDWGWIENEEKYHQLSPPSYKLSEMTAPPTVVFYGLDDYLADPQDISTIFKEVPNATIVGQHALPTYAHLDFVWGLNAYIDVYPQVLQYIQQYKKK